ncbi:uncharacterized protein EDB91DRAFT_1183193 [Suillus paluster]|uniref:uncharacterized protein n=1 Tax=Suillus paluster TaxID=48578 RepID=UPI001B875217|nr:uncharacterized protein EDB91DRAFT_1183193 [Suillus paluster]KAG1718868.1 hypothetical protein EDB91DRAFT_1183193 [Suillus paluster]
MPSCYCLKRRLCRHRRRLHIPRQARSRMAGTCCVCCLSTRSHDAASLSGSKKPCKPLASKVIPSPGVFTWQVKSVGQSIHPNEKLQLLIADKAAPRAQSPLTRNAGQSKTSAAGPMAWETAHSNKYRSCDGSKPRTCCPDLNWYVIVSFV